MKKLLLPLFVLAILFAAFVSVLYCGLSSEIIEKTSFLSGANVRVDVSIGFSTLYLNGVISGDLKRTNQSLTVGSKVE